MENVPTQKYIINLPLTTYLIHDAFENKKKVRIFAGIPNKMSTASNHSLKVEEGKKKGESNIENYLFSGQVI